MNAYLSKPVDNAQLMDLIEKYVVHDKTTV